MYEAFREAPQSKKDRSRLKLGLWITPSHSRRRLPSPKSRVTPSPSGSSCWRFPIPACRSFSLIPAPAS